MCSQELPRLDLRTLCERLRRTQPDQEEAVLTGLQTIDHSPTPTQNNPVMTRMSTDHNWDRVPDVAYDLLDKLIDLNPDTRIKAKMALQHPLFTDLNVTPGISRSKSST